MVSGFFDNMYSFINRKTEQMIRSFILKAAYYISFICFTVDSVITYPKSGNQYPWRGKFPIQLASVNFAILLLLLPPKLFPLFMEFSYAINIHFANFHQFVFSLSFYLPSNFCQLKSFISDVE